MDAYDRCTNLEKKILPKVLPSMIEAENFSGHNTSVIFYVGTAQVPFCVEL
jgi:hypothetical protein